MQELKLGSEVLTGEIIGAAIEVHRALGPGLLESAYQACLEYEFNERGIPFAREVPLPVRYKGKLLDCGYRMDFVVADEVVVETKSAEKIIPIYEAQLLTQLRLSGNRIGLLINFNVTILKNGIKRMVL